MEYFGRFLSATVDFMSIPINVFGFEISMWGVFLFTFLSSILGFIIGRLAR